MRAVRRGTRHLELRTGIVRPPPLLQIDDVEDEAVPIDEKHRGDTVAHPVEALDRRQRERIAVGLCVRRRGSRRIPIGIEQQHAGRNRAVLVTGECRHAQHLDHVRHEIRTTLRGAQRRLYTPSSRKAAT